MGRWYRVLHVSYATPPLVAGPVLPFGPERLHPPGGVVFNHSPTPKNPKNPKNRPNFDTDSKLLMTTFSLFSYSKTRAEPQPLRGGDVGDCDSFYHNPHSTLAPSKGAPRDEGGQAEGSLK